MPTKTALMRNLAAQLEAAADVGQSALDAAALHLVGSLLPEIAGLGATVHGRLIAGELHIDVTVSLPVRRRIVLHIDPVVIEPSAALVEQEMVNA